MPNNTITISGEAQTPTTQTEEQTKRAQQNRQE